ncbi:hypothetical protein Cgig2_023119 [Carnegiea gigantea]|uniref:Ubiquitin-like protease family profile domain-containing protein n=1 Tax=Carnegiea gigantea TaxID=171969 RepID=A0A9Q1JRR1_9CARY|nr:hypothetical protein Cgig2_023119 [Carnegiea gigantea]
MVYHNEQKAIILANIHPSRFFFSRYVYVFFPILRSEHFFFVVFQFSDKIVNIIDNLMLLEKSSTRYGNCDTLLDNINLYDCGIHTMRHVETYYGDLQSWDHVFQKEKEALLRILRVKYAAQILLDPDNLLRDNTLCKAKLETRVREQQLLH